MKFNQVIEDGISLTVIGFTDPNAPSLAPALAAMMGNDGEPVEETRIQCADGSVIQIRIGGHRNTEHPYMLTAHGDQVLVHIAKPSEKVGGGLVESVLNSHKMAGTLELVASGQVRIEDHEALEDLVYTFGMLDREHDQELWARAASQLQDGITAAHDAGALATYQFKHLNGLLGRTYDKGMGQFALAA